MRMVKVIKLIDVIDVALGYKYIRHHGGGVMISWQWPYSGYKVKCVCPINVLLVKYDT